MIGKFDSLGNLINMSGNVDYQTVLNALMPVGYVYVQYPQTKSPEELWPGFTWQVKDYSGAFFRSTGGCANGYASCTDVLANCKQSSQNAYHSHTVCDHSHSASTSANGGGNFWVHSNGYGSVFPVGTDDNTCFCKYDYGDVYGSGDYSFSYYRRLCLRDHGHTIYGGGVCGSLPGTSTNGSSTNTEARPENYTIRIWVRTA